VVFFGGAGGLAENLFASQEGPCCME